MSKSAAYKHYLRVLSRWPKDALRPESQFQDAMRRRIDRKFLDAATATAGSVKEKAELEQVNALYSLLENRYDKKYQLSGSLTKPASNPNYYKQIIEEIERAPTRSWLEATINRWKGFIRFQ